MHFAAKKLYWDVKKIGLHSFTHLGENKVDPQELQILRSRAQTRLAGAGYEVTQTPYGFFPGLIVPAPGHPLAKVYEEF